jgi:hypothetical protein
VRINATTPVNAVGATILFDPEVLMIVGISKEHSFLDLWTEETIIKEAEGEIRFSGGTLRRGGLSGAATILTLTARMKRDGQTELSFKDVQVLASDGKGSALENDARPFSLTIARKEGQSGSAPQTQNTNADFNNDGSVTLADMSILAVQMLSSYNQRYDLDGNGSVGLGDVSVLLAALGAK